MKKNKLLNVAVVICKSIRIFIIIAFIGITTIFIHLQIAPENYEKGNLEFKVSGFQISKISKWKISNSGEDKEVFTLSKIKKTSLYINYLKISAVFLLMFLSIKEFQKIMQSVKSLNTFQKNNVRSFRKIGRYIFIIFLLMSYAKISFQQGGMSYSQISFTPLILMLTSFILAEIFKEGNLLQQENDLTI